MSANLEKIKKLQDLIGKDAAFSEVQYRPFSCLEDLGYRGLPQSVLMQWAGFGKTELCLQLLRENPEASVAWGEPYITVYPFAFLQRQVALNRVLFIESRKYELENLLAELIRSQVFDFLVVSSELLALPQLRRLQLLIEKTNSSLIFLSKQRGMAWPIKLQLQVDSLCGENSVQVMKSSFSRSFLADNEQVI